MVKLLKEEISDVPVRTGRYKVIADFKFFIKIDSHLHRDLIVFLFFLIVFGNLFFGISQRVISYLEQFRMLADSGDIFGCRFLPITISLLDKVSWVF